jgi:hypothetical protein
METFSNHTNALFALQNSASLPNTQPNSPYHSRGWTLLGFTLNLFSIKSRTLSWSKGVLALSLLTLTLSSRVWGQIYSENFNVSSAKSITGTSVGTNGWKRVENVSSVNRPRLENSTSCRINSDYCLKINAASDDGGAPCAYVNSDNYDVVVYDSAKVNASCQSTLKLNFKWAGTGESGWDYWQIVTCPGTSDPTVFGNWSVSSGSGNYCNNASTQTVSNFSLPSSLNGTYFYIGFRWINDASGGGTTVAIDDVSITGTSFTSPSLSAHPSTGTQSQCQNGTSFTALSVTASGTSPSYQWQSSTTSNGSSGWTNLGTNSNSYTPSNSSTGTLYYRCVVSNCAGSVNSNVSGAITTTAIAGDETSYGSGSWIGYVYNSSSAGSFTTYKGSVTESENFDRDCSTGSATGATSNLCSPNSDLFAIRYKMNKSYAAGIYTITVGADDGVRLSVDGGSTWLIDDWRDHGYRTTSASVSLSGSTNLVIEYYENSGGARCSFSISSGQPTTLQGFGTTKYTTCGGTFYDSGGSGSNYTNDESYTVTFYPATSGDKVRLTFSSFATESSYDGMMIYDGNSTSATLISSGLVVGTNSTTCPAGSWRGSLSGSTLPKSAGGSNGVVTSSASDGSLTVVFKSDGGAVAAGWAAAVSCYTPCSTPTISYSGSPYVFCLNSAISDQTPTVTNSPTSFSISPALPAGLSFNASTGVISGTPTTFTAATNYTITANNGCSGTTSISIATGATTTNKGSVSPSATQTICSGESIAFTGGGSPAVNLGSVQYYWYLGHDIDGVGTDWVDWQEIGTSASLPAYNPRSLPVFANSSKFLFVRRVVSSCGAQGNPNYENQDHYIEVNLTPKPTVATSTPASRCGAGTVALGATASAGATIDWYAAASGGTILTTGVPNPAQGTLSFTTPSISATTSYYAQARNTTLGCLSTARTEIIATVASAPTTYYSKSTGNLNDVATWGSNSDGTGCSPANFTADGITYIIQNNAAPTTSGVWAVSGTGSIVKVGNGSSAITFTAGGNLTFTCDLEITGNATLSLGSNNMTLSGDFVRSASTAGFSQTSGSASTVTFSGSSQEVNVTALNGTTPTDSDITFNHIVIDGASVKLFYFKTNDRKLNINNFTVNSGKVVTLYSNPQP